MRELLRRRFSDEQGHFCTCYGVPASFVPVEIRQTGMVMGPENQCQLEG
jgi:hypothetical protein